MNHVLKWVLIGLGIVAALFLAIIVFESLNKSQITVEKPAIYLYPTEDSVVNVKLEINGEIINDEPRYNHGWNVFVTTEGLIDGKYDYLFYEARLNKIEPPTTGWIVKSEDLDQWFEINLKKMGLNEKEKEQFKEYWLPRLSEAQYYEIKLFDDSFLKQNMDLLVSPTPDTMIRLEFYFKPLQKEIAIKEPSLITPIRSGFTVVEWGGMVEN